MISVGFFRKYMIRVCDVAMSNGKTWFESLTYSRLFYFSLLFLSTIPAGYAGSAGERLISASALPDVGGLSLSVKDYMVNPSLVDTVVTVRCSNPQFNATTQEYVLDVEFKSNISGLELFGMNVRFYYNDVQLEFVNFRGFLGGYGVTSPNPAIVSYSATLGPAYFTFGGGADIINGAIQLNNENADPILISTSGWTKLFQIGLSVDDPNANPSSFCPAFVWDLELNPVNGGFLGGEGVVMTVVKPSGGSRPVFENVSQFNWAYIGNGNSPPYGNPVNTTCISIEGGSCDLLVTSLSDAGAGSLRAAIACATINDTIRFSSTLNGSTINITTTRIAINKNLHIIGNGITNTKIASSIAGLFDLSAGKTIEFKDISITSGIAYPGNLGAAFSNFGYLKFFNVKVFRNAALASGQYLINNRPASQFNMYGSSFIQYN